MSLDFCPACHGTALRPTLTVSAAQAAQHFVLRQALPAQHDALVDHIRTLWQQDNCRILGCDRCDSAFADPFVAGDAKFYNLAYPRVEHPRMKWEFKRTFEALKGEDTLGKSALEVGAGNGSFLDLVCPALFAPSRVLALEYNDIAANQLRHKGYTALATDLREPALDGYRGSMDFILIFQVIEHLDRLHETFDRVRELASPKASVFISVPNKLRTDYQERNGSLLDMPPNHIGRWSMRALEILGRRHGFVVEKQEVEPFSAREFLRQDLTFSYLRRAQRPRTISNRLRSMPLGRTRQILELALAATSVPSRAGAWARASTQFNQLGASVWVHLRRD